jgi:hypothetical protein
MSSNRQPRWMSFPIYYTPTRELSLTGPFPCPYSVSYLLHKGGRLCLWGCVRLGNTHRV